MQKFKDFNNPTFQKQNKWNVWPDGLESHEHDIAHWKCSPYTDSNLSNGNELSYNIHNG